MQCYHCGATVRPGSRLCSNCGARLDTQPREPRFARGSKSSWEDEPEESSNVDDRSSRRRAPNPLDDPRAPRVLREPPLSSLRRDDRQDSRRDGSRTDESWDAYQQSPGRGRSPARPESRHPRGYDEAAGADSTEYSAEHPDYPTGRGRDRRDVIYDSRMPRSRAAGTPLERDVRRGSRRSQGPSSYAGDARRGQPHDVGARARGGGEPRRVPPAPTANSRAWQECLGYVLGAYFITKQALSGRLYPAGRDSRHCSVGV